MKRISSLKDYLKEGKLIRAVGAHNGLTARLVEEAGFEAVWSSGLEISTSHALPDANILTMTDFLHAAEEMVGAVNIPLIADCDTGFGNSNNVMHMVKKFEAMGVNAVCIEDKKFPKVNSFVPGRQDLASLAEFVGKIMAAKNAQGTKDFMVFARTEALIAGWGLQEALRRARAYIEAGADGIFIHSKAKSPNEIIEFCKAWKRHAPLLISPTAYCLSEKEMAELGIGIVIYANQGIRAAIKNIQEVLGHINKHGTTGIESKVVSMDEVFRLQGMNVMKDNERKFLKTESGTVKAIIPAAGEKMDESLRFLLEDRPLAMLDINGKSILQRNIETLNICGIQDVNIIAGYKCENIISAEGVKIIKNPDFKNSGILHSIMKGIDTVADKNVILYSDIVIDRYLLQKLLKQEGDIVLVVDRTYKKTHVRNKKLELVKVKFPPHESSRVIDTDRKNPVVKIGNNLAKDQAHYEFIGVALLTKKGISTLLEEYNKSKPTSLISFVGFVQNLIDAGHEVLAYEINNGWMEVHNFEDYKRACSIFY